MGGVMRKLCAHGHELAGDNVYLVGRGRRKCVACREAQKVKFSRCAQGHAMTGTNVLKYVNGVTGKTKRACRKCHNEYRRDAAARKAAGLVPTNVVKLEDYQSRAKPRTEPGAWHWWNESWEQDRNARAYVARAGGLKLAEIGILCGRTRERVRQIEETAIAKLRKRARSGDPALRDAAESLLELIGKRADRDAVTEAVYS